MYSMFLGTDNSYFLRQLKLILLYSRPGGCLLRGTKRTLINMTSVTFGPFNTRTIETHLSHAWCCLIASVLYVHKTRHILALSGTVLWC